MGHTLPYGLEHVPPGGPQRAPLPPRCPLTAPPAFALQEAGLSFGPWLHPVPAHPRRAGASSAPGPTLCARAGRRRCGRRGPQRRRGRRMQQWGWRRQRRRMRRHDAGCGGGCAGGAERGWRHAERVLSRLVRRAAGRRRGWLRQWRLWRARSRARQRSARLARQGGSAGRCPQQRVAPGRLPELRSCAWQPPGGRRCCRAAAVRGPGHPAGCWRYHERVCLCGQPALAGAAPGAAAGQVPRADAAAGRRRRVPAALSGEGGGWHAGRPGQRPARGSMGIDAREFSASPETAL